MEARLERHGEHLRTLGTLCLRSEDGGNLLHIQGRDLFLGANRRGGCWVETEDEEEYSWTLKSGKAHRSPGPASCCHNSDLWSASGSYACHT